MIRLPDEGSRQHHVAAILLESCRSDVKRFARTKLVRAFALIKEVFILSKLIIGRLLDRAEAERP